MSTATKQFLNNYGQVIQLSDTDEDNDQNKVEIVEDGNLEENQEKLLSQVECPLCGKSFESSMIQVLYLYQNIWNSIKTGKNVTNSFWRQ